MEASEKHRAMVCPCAIPLLWPKSVHMIFHMSIGEESHSPRQKWDRWNQNTILLGDMNFTSKCPSSTVLHTQLVLSMYGQAQLLSCRWWGFRKCWKSPIVNLDLAGKGLASKIYLISPISWSEQKLQGARDEQINIKKEIPKLSELSDSGDFHD